METDDLKLLSQEQLSELLGFSRSTIHRRLKDDPDFPSKIQISPGRIAFRKSDVLEYIKKKEVS
jgi:predicted DNA-binding transcriptional regulator AlpA